MMGLSKVGAVIFRIQLWTIKVESSDPGGGNLTFRQLIYGQKCGALASRPSRATEPHYRAIALLFFTELKEALAVCKSTCCSSSETGNVLMVPFCWFALLLRFKLELKHYFSAEALLKNGYKYLVGVSFRGRSIVSLKAWLQRLKEIYCFVRWWTNISSPQGV